MYRMSYSKNGVMYRDDGTVRSVRPPREPRTDPVKNSGMYWASGGGGSTGMTYTYKPMTGTSPSIWAGGGGGGMAAKNTWPFEDDGEVQIEELWEAVQAAALPTSVINYDEFGLPVFE